MPTTLTGTRELGSSRLTTSKSSPTSRPSASATASPTATGIDPFGAEPSAGQAPSRSVAWSSMPSEEPNVARSRTPAPGWSGSANVSDRTTRTTDPGTAANASSSAALDGRIDLGQPVGRHPRDRLDVHLGRRRVGQRPVQARERHRIAVHHAGREEGRRERAHDPRGEHDRPVGAGSAEADPEQSAERRDQLRRLPDVNGAKSAEYTEGRPETGILGSPGRIWRPRERRHPLPPAHLAAQPQDAVAGVVRLLRLERVRRRPRHRVQRDPRGGGADRRLTALQVPRLRAGRPAPRGSRRHPGRDEALDRWSHVHAVV